MDKNEYSDVEKLAIMQAIYTTAADYVSTKNPDSLRSDVDYEYKKLYELTGAKSFDVKVNDSKVGTYSIRMSKPKPSEEKTTFEVDSYEELAKWVEHCVSDEALLNYVALHLKEFAQWHFESTGELPDCCSLNKTVTAEEPPSYMGGTLKIDAQAVVSAMGGLPNAGIEALLLGGSDDQL